MFKLQLYSLSLQLVILVLFLLWVLESICKSSVEPADGFAP